MLINESLWIGSKLKKILPENPFPVLNVGSSTEKYRKVHQPYVQQNIFNLFGNEKEQVIHLDMKQAEGVDLVGNLYDSNFLEKIKKIKVKTVFCNNILMYLEKEQRENLADIFYEILDSGSYLLISNSYMFPAAPDPKEAYYRNNAEEMYKDLFSRFKLLDLKDVEDNKTHFQDLRSESKILLLKKFVAFFIFTAKKYKKRDWSFMINYYLKNINKNYSAACLFLQK